MEACFRHWIKNSIKYQMSYLRLFIDFLSSYKLAILACFLRIVRYKLTIAIYEAIIVRNKVRIVGYKLNSDFFLAIASLCHTITKKKKRIASLYQAIERCKLTIVWKKSELWDKKP